MRIYTYGIVLSCLLMVSCIKNDIPYPYILGDIYEFEVEGQTGEAGIDLVRRTIQITIDERAELDNLKVTKLVANPEATIFPDKEACINSETFPDFSFTSLKSLPANANTAIDFTSPVKFLLQTYQDYLWTVSVKQVINRVISVENQIGPAMFDEETKIAIVYVSADQPLSKIKVLEMNLEGVNSTLIPDPLKESDFRRPVQFAATRKGKTVVWTVNIVQKTELASTKTVETWGKKAIMNGEMISGATPVVEYKKNSSSDWIVIDQNSVEISSKLTSFKATIKGLDDGTEYQWRIGVNGEYTDPASFTTEKIEIIPNLNFDTWTQDGTTWYANPVADNLNNPQAYWATGNEGVTSIGKNSITIPVDDAVKGKAAKLTTITGVTAVGSASGNLFIGKYETKMLAPRTSVLFGRPFTGARPTRLKGHYKYSPEPITNGTFPKEKMQTDQGHIYVKIWDKSWESWDQAKQDDSKVKLIAYGELVISEKVNGYTEFEFEIKYTDLSARPAAITIVATSSRYGGEFDGMKVVGQVGKGSTLWVDEFELLYD